MSTVSTDDLQRLHKRLADSRDGYEKAAEAADAERFKELFSRRSAQRRAFADKIRAELANRGEKPGADGTVTGATHRAWMGLAAAVGDSDRAVAAEVSRGEKHLLDTYDELMDGLDPDNPLHSELSHQQSEIAKMVESTERMSAEG